MSDISTAISKVNRTKKYFRKLPNTEVGLKALRAYGMPSAEEFDLLVEVGQPFLISEWAHEWDFVVDDEHGLRSAYPEVWNMISKWTLSPDELADVLVQQRNLQQLYWLVDNHKQRLVPDYGNTLDRIHDVFYSWPAGSDLLEKELDLM